MATPPFAINGILPERAAGETEGERGERSASLALARAPSRRCFLPPSLLPARPPSPAYLKEAPLIRDVDSRRRRRDPRIRVTCAIVALARDRSRERLVEGGDKKNGIYRKSQSRRSRPLANYN